MLAKRIALIGILAVAIFVVGCSDKQTATAPTLVSANYTIAISITSHIGEGWRAQTLEIPD